ncbi:NUDIX hydrolase [Brasilonema sp. UFV-L1]|uniref:NUDIX hydrolase n=1 Tax=Brasilonema sp. UFV-L1 TaxID=2234130 RepID=UPI00145D9B80|nr:NUDIX hydrolase [Brasilonema sp. UFV-L1]NMG11465.1 NUDIX hydrolase [Brasilonema sp. UFV-L1]
MTTEVAIAILYQKGKFLMQLRDNNPDIAYPGHWGLFGGHIELGETPEVAVQREILEEIGYTLPSTFSKFGCYPDERAVRHVFWAPLTVELNQLVLNEGWDMSLITPEDIRLGVSYSAVSTDVRPLGSVHQRILLDFMERHDKLFHGSIVHLHS